MSTGPGVTALVLVAALSAWWPMLGPQPRRGRARGAHAARAASASLPGPGPDAPRAVATAPTPVRRRPTGRSLVVGAVLATALHPALGLAAVVASPVRSVLAFRRRRRSFEAAVVAELPDLIDLLRLALSGGGSILVAARLVATRPTGPITAALADCLHRVDHGHRLADVLDDLPERLGDVVRPLVRALVSGERYGIELGPTLDRLAAEARDDRRRRAQAAARRVPVRMLVPLVAGVLPAFVLSTVVPTLVGTFRTLELERPP